ncbi:Zn-dependent alcohol dehydrogenase [Aeromicrobium sp.]|uniref:Zn-dependent alcohol dehydrogenase n=1 Tax=Aeromicrobium sp. TaxID=1871063 RepID=UPI0019A66EF9|nr:Zn-dependent alcohol dehydrogenase [Aeromicrobium sp.]MBC7630377.1 Zn-dependent alcohol dehydrogenase [Aeromicrobium sp.]
MKASVVNGVGRGFTVQDLVIGEPRGFEVLVDVRASGLCHSDLHLAEVDYGLPMPTVLGHEVAGVVLAVGPAVTAARVGDHVVACLVKFCGRCIECTSGHTFACSTPNSTLRSASEPPRLTYNGVAMEQAHGIGGFAEQSLVHENQLAVVSKEIPFTAACIIGCGTVTGAGAAINTAQVRPGDTVAVLGTGGVGLNTISGARLAGALRIIAIDVDDSKLEVARRFGATDVINATRADPVEAVKALVDGGVTHAFEVIGLPQTQAQAVQLARHGGGVHLVGVARPGTTLEIESSLGMLRAHTAVSGVHMGSTNLKRDIPMFVDYYLQGRLNLDDLVSQEIGLADIPKAYEQLRAGKVIRSVITSF